MVPGTKGLPRYFRHSASLKRWPEDPEIPPLDKPGKVCCRAWSKLFFRCIGRSGIFLPVNGSNLIELLSSEDCRRLCPAMETSRNWRKLRPKKVTANKIINVNATTFAAYCNIWNIWIVFVVVIFYCSLAKKNNWSLRIKIMVKNNVLACIVVVWVTRCN